MHLKCIQQFHSAINRFLNFCFVAVAICYVATYVATYVILKYCVYDICIILAKWLIFLAALLLKKYHDLIYQLFHSDHQWNISVIQEHCTIPHHYEQHIMTAATAEDSNERILTFLEDAFLRSGKYDEFFVIVQKLIEMPSALPIIERMQKGINSIIAVM